MMEPLLKGSLNLKHYCMYKETLQTRAERSLSKLLYKTLVPARSIDTLGNGTLCIICKNYTIEITTGQEQDNMKCSA